MTTCIITLDAPIPKTPEEKAREYIARVERRRERDAARAIRRYQRFMDELWNTALYGGAVFFTLAAVAALTSII